jgi:NAD(P)-dependent dehydrogenase (short-subunit alcohol dehydrogenase family)
MTKNLAEELGPRGINVTVVHPGLTRTESTPDGAQARNAIGRMVDASEVADVIAFLCSPRSVAVNGDAIAAGGGALGPIHY